MISIIQCLPTVNIVGYLSCLFLFVACGAIDNYQSSKVTRTAQTTNKKKIEFPFDLQLQLDEVENNFYNLSVAIELDSGSYIISPFSKDSTYLHFSIAMEDNRYLIADETLLEIPSSVEEFDPILNEPVKFVRVNTTYKQQIKVLSQENFQVAGLIEFLVEPSCIPYDIEFVLSSQVGKLNVKKTKTFISKEYKL